MENCNIEMEVAAIAAEGYLSRTDTPVDMNGFLDMYPEASAETISLLIAHNQRIEDRIAAVHARMRSAWNALTEEEKELRRKSLDDSDDLFIGFGLLGF